MTTRLLALTAALAAPMTLNATAGGGEIDILVDD